MPPWLLAGVAAVPRSPLHALEYGSQAAPGAPVIFIGLQKSGTSTFAHFMGNLGYDSVHGGLSEEAKDGGFAQPLMTYAPGWDACSAAPSKLMDHDTVVSEMAPERRAILADFLVHVKHTAFADVLWPLLFRFVDQVTDGRAKFVLWPRDASEWAQSFANFYDMNNTDFNRFNLLSYGCVHRCSLARQP